MKTFTISALITSIVIHVAAAASANATYMGYTTGSVDRTIAKAAVQAGEGVIIDQVFYQVGYGAGQVDRALASAAYKASIAVK
jgi:hypothetical protein